MTDRDIAGIERACARIVHAYARHADFGEAGEAAALFAESGRLEMSNGQVFDGREAVRARLEQQPQSQVSRHVISNVLIDVVDANRASGSCYLTLYRGTRVADGALPLDAPFLVGHYEDRFVLTPDGWKFALRKLMTTFRSRAAS